LGSSLLNTNNKTVTNNASSSSSGQNSNGHIIYVYGIGPQATESDLYALFSHCGNILRVNVIKNQKTGQCKGYGFVVFEQYEEAYRAVHSMNGFMYNHRPLQVSFKSFSK
jgi:RNA recognition motif-containing protein